MKMEQVPAIYKTDPKKTLKYLKELLKGRQRIKKSTIMIVGEEGVGKTTFVKNILGDRWAGDTFHGFDLSLSDHLPSPVLFLLLFNYYLI